MEYKYKSKDEYYLDKIHTARDKIESLKEQIEAYKLIELSKDITIKTQQGEIARLKGDRCILNQIRDIINCTDFSMTKYRNIKQLLKEGDN